ncbi:response regulator transcription factor [Coleofasciculus sp. FACHB-129]|uniref:response regulator n=1 Tax=Cyanophyceae TaxID=3028117 RepID=UPI001682C037|nr:response regulator transcription factor [Coleofasciculus sp. FACHB-129]MBD1895947.1 response regulator transcription factor [Coleofasciculus sp. FACHB-129]
MKPSLRILLVEDDELFRLGLRMRLQQAGLEVVGEAVDGETAVELTNCHLPDVVLLDVGLPGLGGVEACRQIKQRHPKMPVLVLTSHSQKPLIERLIAAGAHGYCLKGIEAEVLILALRSVAAGASWWDQTGTAEIRAAFDDTPTPTSPKTAEPLATPLTSREQEILALIAAGKTNQEIAERLHIALGTVRVHVHAILQKLEVRDRTQAAILAIQERLVAADLLLQE